MKRLSLDASSLAMRAKSLRIQTNPPSSVIDANNDSNNKKEVDDNGNDDDDDNDSLLLTPASSTVAASPTAMSATIPSKRYPVWCHDDDDDKGLKKRYLSL